MQNGIITNSQSTLSSWEWKSGSLHNNCGIIVTLIHWLGPPLFLLWWSEPMLAIWSERLAKGSYPYYQFPTYLTVCNLTSQFTLDKSSPHEQSKITGKWLASMSFAAGRGFTADCHNTHTFAMMGISRFTMASWSYSFCWRLFSQAWEFILISKDFSKVSHHDN